MASGCFPLWCIASLDRVASESSVPLHCNIIRKGEDRRKKKREVLHLFRCYTHTHPAGAGSTLKGKRNKKAKTDDGQKAKTAQGGRGTDGPPRPTYTAKRTWPKQCTHLNPTTHYGEARGELGTKWGTSWWQTRKNKTISLKIRTQKFRSSLINETLLI